MILYTKLVVNWIYLGIGLLAVVNGEEETQLDTDLGDPFNAGLSRVKREFCEEGLPTVENVGVIENNAEVVSFKWEEVPNAEWYALDVDPTSKCVEGLENVTTNEAKISSLDTGTSYSLSVVAYGKDGTACSQEPAKISFNTDEGDGWTCDDDVEIDVIEGLEAPDEQLTTNSALIKWLPATNALSYIVKLTPESQSNGIEEITDTEIHLFGLQSGYNYTVEVTPKGKRKHGTTEIFKFVTKLHKPEQFKVLNVSSNFFRAEWEADEFSTKFMLRLFEIGEEGNETFVEEKEEADTFVYFNGLTPATTYRVEIQGTNDNAVSMTESETVFTKLPTPRNVTKWNVTYHSVNAAWNPVSEADRYRVEMRPLTVDEKPPAIFTTEAQVVVDNLIDASEYFLDIFALNKDGESLPGSIHVYTRLKSPKMLNVDVDYTQDTSMVVRWGGVAAAYWYFVSLEPNVTGVTGIGVVNEIYTHIKNLRPGIVYKITLVSMNAWEFPTESAPVSIFQATQLPRPQNVTIAYSNVKHDSMTVAWNGLPMTDIFYVYAYDCSGKGSKVDPNAPRSTIGPTTMPAAYRKYMDSWKQYTAGEDAYEKPVPTKLTCEKVFVDVKQALREANKSLPSNVEGQGRIEGTQVTLANMYPGTRYEIVVAAGEGPKQSDAAITLRYTKLPDSQNFRFDPDTLSEAEVELHWDPVEGSTYYEIETLKTFNMDPTKPFAKKAEKIVKHLKKEKALADETYRLMRGLSSSTNYTFLLTAKNEHTESFPVSVNTFSRLPSPSSVTAKESTNIITLQWGPVSKVQHYDVTYAASRYNMPDEEKTWITIQVENPAISLEDLTPNTKYELKLRSVNVFTQRLPVPENVTITNLTDNIISLEWSPVPGCKTYGLHISKNNEQPEAFRKSVKKTRYTFEGLQENQPYYIFMKATNLNTESEKLTLFQYTKLPLPEMVTFVDIKDKSIRLRWRAVKASQVYMITVMAMHNESMQDNKPPFKKKQIVEQMSMADGKPIEGKRGKREITKLKSSSRQIRSASASDGVHSITYKTRRGMKNAETVFLNSHGVYNINVTDTDVVFGKLEPGVKYVTILKAWNKFTDSLPVKKQTFTKLESPTRLEIREVDNHTLVVRWIKVSKASYYRITITSEKKPFMRESDVLQIEGITIDTEMSVIDLLPNTKYKIEVRAGNKHIESYASEIEQITKLSEVEDLQVINSSVTYNSFIIRWNPVEHALRYIVVVNPPLRNGKNTIEVPATETEARLFPLRDTTNYKVTVSASNDRTAGVMKHIFQYTKLLTPENFTIVEEYVNSSYFRVEWLPVRAADEYHVQLLDNQEDEIKLIKPKKTQAQFKRLSSGHKYWVVVKAHSKRHKTFSDEVRVWTFTKLETPKNFSVDDSLVTDVSLTIEWAAVDLAKLYKVTSAIQARTGDHSTIYQHIKERTAYVQTTSITIEDLRPASYYYVIMKAINEDTESENVSLNVFTRLPEPTNLTLLEHFYMDTEAELTWLKVDRAEGYAIEVFAKPERPENVTEDDWNDMDILDQFSVVEVDSENETLVYEDGDIKKPFHTVNNLTPETTYVAALSATNRDTHSDWTTEEFTTKSACEDDFHLFPSTQLTQALPVLERKNMTEEECMQECCEIRDFKCRSISLHKETHDCALYAENRETAPPLGLSKYYDHYERKFWKEVTGFQIRSLSHNNVAVINKTVDLILTFVYVGKTGCIEWDLDDGTKRYHSILDTDCSYLCKQAPPGTNCTILPANPIENSNQVNTSHVYDMNNVYRVRVNVSDQGSYEVKTFEVAINERGCIYPQIVIEEDAKNILLPKKLHRSSKLVLSTTPTIICDSFPGVSFDWTAVLYEVNSETVKSSIELSSFGSEILIPPLKLELGLYRITAIIDVHDEEHDLKDTDSVYIDVVASPLVAKIKGGNMRTVGHNRIVKWDASSKSHDPDTLGPDRYNLQFMWLCRNYTDEKITPLDSGNCFPDLNVLTFDGPGIFSLNTTIMHLYHKYEFEVVVTKGDRMESFKQQVIVKEGDPPEFFIECKENCKKKMNPTQALALNGICLNCKHQRNPSYEWSLYEVIALDKEDKDEGIAMLESVEAELIEEEDYPEEDLELVDSGIIEENNEKLVELFDWDGNTTTNIDSPILVLRKHSLPSGRKYILRLNISMDGLDDRVHSFSDFTFQTNLPPDNGVCTTFPATKSCQNFRNLPETRILGIEPRKTYGNLTEKECSEKCCLIREFLCLTFMYNAKKSNCNLYSDGRLELEPYMVYDKNEDFHQRIFYIGGAVVDEIFFECRNWRDEGEALTKEDEKGSKAPPLTYKYTALPYGNRTEPLLLYFGTVTKTPGISMTLGDPEEDYVVSVVVQICDMFGECALSNTITIQVVPPDTTNVGDTLSGFTNGNDSKLAIFSTTGNSKAAAQLVQSIASIINMNEEEEDMTLGRNRTNNETDWMATTAPTLMTTDVPIDDYYTTYGPDAMNRTGNATGVINKELKKDLRKNVMRALSDASKGMTSIDNLKQMTSAMNSITQKPDEITKDSQRNASSTVLKMAASLSDFSDEANKEDIADAAKNIIGSLGSVAKSSETDMTDLKSQMLQPSEINFNTLDEMDQSPDEFEFYSKIKLKEEKRRVRRSALDSEEVMGSALNAIDGTANSLLDKQMSGEPPEVLSSDRMEMMVKKTSPESVENEDLSTGKGTSVKLPGSESLFGKSVSNMTEPVDLQVMAFDDNPLGFGEDAAFINSPVTMLKIGGRDNSSFGNDTDENEGEKPGVGITIPNNKFNSEEDMMTIERNINDTGLSISKFEMLSQNNAILIVVEPEDDRNKFDVFLKFHAKPSHEDYDFKFSLPHDIWDVTMRDDQFKIFIPEKDVKMTGMVFIGIQDNLNVSLSREKHRGKVRRRRSLGIENSTTYHLLISTPGCRRFDSETKKWTGDGCKVSEHSTPETTECFCNKLSSTSIFSAEFFVPPNTINFATVFAKINIADNPAVFSTVITLLIIYILLLIWARRQDKKDKTKWELKSIMDNRKEDKYLYQVTVFTGYGGNAGTHSNVFCVLFGENGKTNPRQLRIREDKTPFTRSSVNHFLIRVNEPLGNMTHVHVWHDNTGKGENRGWYLDQIAVQDIQTGERFYFICDNWLAVDQDDGLVDRILPVATPENMSTFHRLFITTTSQKFTEDHLWISVFYRPTKSNFTRVQRLSCCILLLFMTMIANAMWFESGQRSGASATATLNVGPFIISPIQLWTSFCSTLMVVPVVTSVVMIFKKAKTKEQEEFDKKVKARKDKALKRVKRRLHDKAATLPDPSDLIGKDAVYTIDKQGKIQAKEKTKRAAVPPPNTWPHKCVYIAWVLVVLGVLLSGFFAILYSFEWGRVKAERWLSNMMLSFWQSVLIVQPVKVIILSIFVAAIVRKPDEQVMDSVQEKDVDDAEKKFTNLCAENIESEIQQNEIIPPKPPSQKRLRRTRRLRAKERAMSDILWEVIVYFFYIMVLLFLCHGSRDSKGFRITNSVKNTFVEPKYGLKSVTSVEYFWRFMNITLLPNIYPVEWYNGKKKNWRERSFLVDEQSYRVGPARLRQIRVMPSACPYSSPVRQECRLAYAWHLNDEEDYEPGWIPISSIPPENRTEPDPDDPLAMAWKYRSWTELKGMPILGGLTAYPGGGYSAELGVNYISGKYIVDKLYRDAWIDHHTRVVFIEFTVYNPNVNLFTTINLMAEFPAVGAAVHFTSIVSFRLYHYVGSYGTLVVCAQAIFVIHLLYATYKSIKALVTLKKKFIRDPWNVFEAVILVFDWGIVGLTGLRLVLTDQTIESFHDNKRKYVNFQQVTSVDLFVGYFLALSAFMGMLRFLKLLRFNKRIGMLSSVLKYSARQWPGFFVLAAVFFISFIHVGYIVFCPFLETFKTMISTAESMIDTMMGGKVYPMLRDTYRFFGPIYYFLFCFTALFIIMNILIAIIGESHKRTNVDLEAMSNQYEMIDFMMKRFMKWSGMDRYVGKNKKKPTEQERAENSVTASPTGDTATGVAEDDGYTDKGAKNLVEFQKRLDVYSYELENKYKKLLSFDELRSEVIAQMRTDRDIIKEKIVAAKAKDQPSTSRARPQRARRARPTAYATTELATVSGIFNDRASLFSASR